MRHFYSDKWNICIHVNAATFSYVGLRLTTHTIFLISYIYSIKPGPSLLNLLFKCIQTVFRFHLIVLRKTRSYSQSSSLNHKCICLNLYWKFTIKMFPINRLLIDRAFKLHEEWTFTWLPLLIYLLTPAISTGYFTVTPVTHDDPFRPNADTGSFCETTPFHRQRVMDPSSIQQQNQNSPCPSSLNTSSLFSDSFSFFPRRRFFPPLPKIRNRKRLC